MHVLTYSLATYFSLPWHNFFPIGVSGAFPVYCDMDAGGKRILVAPNKFFVK